MGGFPQTMVVASAVAPIYRRRPSWRVPNIDVIQQRRDDLDAHIWVIAGVAVLVVIASCVVLILGWLISHDVQPLSFAIGGKF